MKFLFMGPVLIFSGLIAYEIRKNSHKEHKKSETFWAREEEANSTRKKDISNLNYIKVPVDSLPLGLCPAFDELNDNEKLIRSLAESQIYSLAGQSNTDVKLEYGIANFEFLCACDERYMSLIQALSKEAELLGSMGFDNEVKQVLEYSLSIGSDLPKDYITLAEIYKDRKDRTALNGLIEKADKLDSLTKKSLIEKLEAVADSF